MTPVLLLPWDIAHSSAVRKRERGLGAPASPTGRSDWALPGLCQGLCPSHGWTGKWGAGRARVEKLPMCVCPRTLLLVIVPPPVLRQALGPGAGLTVALKLGMELLLGAECGDQAHEAGPLTSLNATTSLFPHPVSCAQDHILWSWGAASCHRTVHELAWPCVPMWCHPGLPRGQKGLEQCLSLSTLMARSQTHSLLVQLVHGSSAGVP